MRNTRLVTVLTLVVGGLLFRPEAASAQTCIQDVWKAHGNNQNLTCTANDVTLSTATNITIQTGGACVNGVCSCYAGQTVTFTADFRMDLTADTRYDVGFYLATDNDPNNDGALTGLCSATASLASNTTRPGNFINLDTESQPGDVCGDITGPLSTVAGSHNPLFVTATVSAPCPSTPGQQLRLPFATTWRQPGSNEVCDGTGSSAATNDVYPGSPSKCNKGTLVLDITSITTSISVSKSTSSTVPETGGTASYSVTVNNTTQVPITLTSLTDDKYGDITSLTGSTCVPDNVASTCEVGGTIAAGGQCSCTFSGAVPPGDFGGPNFKDTVQACANNATNSTPVCATDDAEVPYTDLSSAPTLSKTAAATTCQIDQAYDVVVTNTSALDTLTLSALNDSIYGDITSVHGSIQSTTCGTAAGAGALPYVIGVAGNYTCSFVARSTSCSTTVHDTVTGTAADEDGVTSSPSDDATVVISVTKS